MNLKTLEAKQAQAKASKTNVGRRAQKIDHPGLKLGQSALSSPVSKSKTDQSLAMQSGANPGSRRNSTGGQGSVPSREGSASGNSVLPCGFKPAEAKYLHEAIRHAGMQWFEGDGLIMAKHDAVELSFRPGESDAARWVVMAFPVINMNVEGAVEVALHFLTESYVMAHALGLQFQTAINLESEHLEFLIQLPLDGLTSQELGSMIRQFVEALAEGIKEELSRLLDEINQNL